MKVWCETCDGTGELDNSTYLQQDTKRCPDCNGKGYTEPEKPTTEINIDYYEELKSKADKWDEKEMPYKPTNVEEVYDSSISDFVKIGNCKCERLVEWENYCPRCGQKLEWGGDL